MAEIKEAAEPPEGLRGFGPPVQRIEPAGPDTAEAVPDRS